MYNPNVPSSNMGIAPISGQPSQPLGPAPMGPPPPMAPPMMGGMPPPPMAPLPTPAPITEGLGGYGGSSSSRAGFSERMQRMTAPPKKAPSGPQPVQQLHGGGMVGGMGGMYGMYGGMGGGGMYGGGMYGGGMMPPMPMPAMYQPSMMGYGGMGGMYGGGFGINRPNYSMGGYNNQNRPQPFQSYEPARPSYTSANRSPFDGSFSSDPVATPSVAIPYERPLSSLGSTGMTSNMQPMHPSYGTQPSASGSSNYDHVVEDRQYRKPLPDRGLYPDISPNFFGSSGQPSFSNAYGDYYKNPVEGGDMIREPSPFAPSQTTAAPVDQAAERKFNAQALFDAARSNGASGGSQFRGNQFQGSGNDPTMGGLLAYGKAMKSLTMAEGGEVPRRTEISGQPHMLAYIDPQEERLLRGLGGSGQPGPGGVPAYAREDGPGSDNFGTAASDYGYGSSGNSSDSSYEDEAYGDDGYGRVDYGGGGGDDSGGDGDDYSDVPVVNLDPDDFGHLEPVLIGDQPAPASGDDGGDDIKDRVIADLVYSSADPTVGPNNAKEALDQASAEIKAGRGDVADLTLATLASRIGRGSDVMPTRLSDIAAISQDFAVPPPEDTTFSDPDEIFNLRNPISLNAAQVVGPNFRRNADGTLLPGRADTKADIEAGTEAARFEPAAPEVMSFDPSIGGSGSNLIGLGPSASELGFDDSIKSSVPVTNTLAEAATFTPTLGGGFGELGGRGQLSVDEDVFSTKDMVLPGDIPTQSTQSFNIPNRVDAGRAALDLLRAEEKRGITSLSNVAEKNEELRKELEILQGRAGERFANNIDEATSFYKPEGTGMDAFNQMLSDPANYEINRVGRLSPEELAQSPFGETEAKFVVPPIGAPITDAELSEARKIYGDFDPTLGAPYVAPPSDIELEVAQPTDGGFLANTLGMQSYLEKYPDGTGGTEFVAPQGTRRRSDGRTVSGIAPSPAPAVISPQNTKYLSPFDISELENLEEDYYKTGAGSSDYDPMAAQATAEALKRAEGDVSALDRIAEARMPTDDMQIVDDMRSVPRSSPEFAAPVGDLAQFEPQVRAASSQPATTADPDGSGTEVDDVDIFGGNFNRNQFTDREFYKNREDLYSLFGPSRGAEIFNSAVKSLSMGLIDLDKLSAKQREKALEAYLETGKLAYNKDGKLIGVEDPDGRAILLGPQPQDDDDTGGDDDGCPPGFRKVNGVCMPIRQNRVAANPATAISDSINRATLPSTLRPVVRDLVDDDDEEETSDVGGLTIRRPKYFAGGGAVSEGMGSAIDSFLSSMGGSVKKKSNVEPVNMFFGGLVDSFTGRNDYTDPYEELERDYGYDPTDPFGDGDTSYGDDSPSDTVTADTFIGPMQPNVTYQPPVDTGGDETDPFVKNAILSARNYYNDGSIGPTMQNASMLPAAPKNVNDITADYVKFIPSNMRNNLMMGKDFSRSLLHAGVDNIGGIVGLGLDDGVTSAGEKFFQTASENPLGTLYNIGLGAAQGVGSALYDPYKAAKTVTDQFISSGKNLMQPVTPETNPDQLLGDISVVGSAFPLFSGVKAAGKLTPKNNTISTDIRPTFKDLNLAHGTPRTDPFKPEIQVQMADGTTQFMDMFSPDGLIETKFTSGFPEGATVVGDYPFGRFSTDFIGAGEGRMIPGSLLARKSSKGAAHGKGVYLAENPELATDVYRFIGQNQYKPDGLPKNFSLDAALRQKQGIINKYGSPEEALEAFESGKVISKPDYNSVSQAYFQGAENALNSDNPILSKISSDLMGGMEPSYRAKLERLKIEKPEEWQTIISNHINKRIGSIRTKSREDQLAKGQKIVDDPDIQRASNILNKNAMDTRNRVYDEKASYDAMLQIMQSGVLPYNTPNIPGSTKRATINESKLGRSLDLDSPSAVGDTRIGFDKNVRQDMLDIFGEAWVADRESGMFPDPKNPGNLLRGAPNQTDYRTEGAYAPRTVEEMNKLADAGYSHLSFYDGKSREVHRRATKRMQDIQKQLEGTTLERYLSYANKNNPQDVAKMTKLYEVEVANLENDMRKARESLTGLTKNYVFFDDKTMPKITESYAKGGQVGMGLGSL